MHVDIVPNRTSRPAILLRETRREEGRVRKRTIANLTQVISMEQALMLRRILKGETLVAPSDAFTVTASRTEGPVRAVLTAMQRLDIETLLASRPSRERSLVTALIAYRVLNPASTQATTHAWHTTTLPTELKVVEASENDVNRAMDWLISRQHRIEAKLANRHLQDGGRVWFHTHSPYVKGERHALTEAGRFLDDDRSHERRTCCLLSDGAGRPIARTVAPHASTDTTNLMPYVEALQERFGLASVTLIGDHDVITSQHVDTFRNAPGIDWITALQGPSLSKLVAEGIIQPNAFDASNLIEIPHLDDPRERLIAYRNPAMGRRRTQERAARLAATIQDLEVTQKRIRNGHLEGRDEIGLEVGETLGRNGMRAYLRVTINDHDLTFDVDQDTVERDAMMDAILVVRTSLDRDALNATEAVRAFESLTDVGRDFGAIGGTEADVQPLTARRPDRAKADVFLGTLAAYVQWHMKTAWARLGIANEDGESNRDQDPDGTPERTFTSILDDLATITRATCTHPETGVTFTMTTHPSPAQRVALDRLDTITP